MGLDIAMLQALVNGSLGTPCESADDCFMRQDVCCLSCHVADAGADASAVHQH